MASYDKPDPESGPKSETTPPPPPPVYLSSRFIGCVKVDIALRVLLFASTLASVVVMVTGNQTVQQYLPGLGDPVPFSAKFNHSPAFIYFIAALSLGCLYSIITTIASISVIYKPALSIKFLLYFAIFDVIMVGLVASATGTAGGVAYIGLKGNKHVRWMKICDSYDDFCAHIGSSVALSLFAAVLLLLLSVLSIFSIYKKIPN